MIQAKALMDDGRVLIVLGLSQGNLDRLKQQRPIFVDPSVLLSVQPGEVIGGITIIYGDTEGDLMRILSEFMGPDTVIHAVPKGSSTPS